MGTLYAATPGQSQGVARNYLSIYIYICMYICNNIIIIDILYLTQLYIGILQVKHGQLSVIILGTCANLCLRPHENKVKLVVARSCEVISILQLAALLELGCVLCSTYFKHFQTDFCFLAMSYTSATYGCFLKLGQPPKSSIFIVGSSFF